MSTAIKLCVLFKMTYSLFFPAAAITILTHSSQLKPNAVAASEMCPPYLVDSSVSSSRSDKTAF